MGLVREYPGNLLGSGRALIDPANAWIWLGIAASTGLMIAVDDKLYEETVKLGDRLGIQQEGKSMVVGRFPLPGLDRDARIFAFPANTGAALYFLGDGWLHIGVMGGFFGYGAIASDCRALQTGWDLGEGMLVEGTISLAIKLSTGREGPCRRDTPTGKWRPFPNPAAYLKDTCNYDAMPSGHLATAMCTVTVIAENYPEKWWIRPLGYSLLVPLMFQMVNNGVHWWSDYPLGLFIGYTVGKTVTARHHKAVPAKSGWVPEVMPVVFADAQGAALTWRF